MEYQNINFPGIQLRFIQQFSIYQILYAITKNRQLKKIKPVCIVCKDCYHVQRNYYVLYEPVPQ